MAASTQGFLGPTARCGWYAVLGLTVAGLVRPGPASGQWEGLPPIITITEPPDQSVTHDQTPEIRVDYQPDFDCNVPQMPGEPDPCDPDESTLLIKVNGVDKTGSFTKHGTYATTTSVVLPDEQWSTIYAKICNEYGCDEDTIQVYVQTLPAPPLVSTEPHNGDILSPALCEGCFDLVFAYTTPAYFTLDVARSVTLFYSSNQAAPRGLVTVDAWDSPYNTSAPDSVSLRLKRPDDTWVTFTTGTSEIFYSFSEGDTLRLSAQFDASGLSSGAYAYTAVVTGWWGSTSKQSTVQVRVLILNERDSDVMSGWTIAGVQTLIPQGDSLVVLLDGAGGIVAFDEVSTDVFRAPRGEFTEIHKTGASTYERIWNDSTTAYFSTKYGLVRVDSITDRFGNKTTFNYNPSIQRITDPMGWRTDFFYTGTWDGLESVYYQDTGGATQVLELTGHATTRDLLTIEDRDELTQTFTYDTLHRVESFTDREGATTDYEYDIHGKLKKITLAEVTLYDEQDERPTIDLISPERRAVPTSSTVDSTVTSSLVYGTTIGPRGDTTKAWFNALGQAVKTVDAVGRTTQMTYQQEGFITDIYLPSGQQIEYNWLWSNPAQKWIPAVTRDSIIDVRGIRYGYESNYHFVDSISQAGKVLKQYYYSSDGRLDSLRIGQADSVIRYFSDALGRDTAVADQMGHTTRYTYDSTTGNLAKVVRHDGQTSERIFDDFGRVEYSISPTSDTTRFVYDQLNRVTAVYDPLNQNPTLIHYGAVFPDSVTDPKGERYVFVHNALGWVTERYGPASATNKDSYGYGIAGNVKNWTNRNGQTVQYDYDLLGRVTTIELPGDTLEYGYDPGGQDRFAWAKNAWSTDTTWYAPWGAVDSTKTARGGPIYRVGYEYGHWSGRPTELHDRFNNRTLSFAYNDLGQLDTMTVRGLKTWVDTRNADLQTTTRRLPAQFSQTLNYSADHSRAEIKWPKTGGGSLASRNYGFDEAGRITDMDPEGNTKYEYEYDRLGRLLRRETYSQDEECWYVPTYPYIECQGTQNLQSVDTFTYDAIGNRTDHGAQIDPGSRLGRIAVHGDTVSYTYDSAGHVTRREKLISGEVKDLYWNALGQLDSVVINGVYSTDTVRFHYDALGRRVALETGGGTIDYVWANGHVLFDTKNGTVTEYSYLPGTDRLHALYRSGEFHYYLTDYVGSTAALADSVGAKENAYTYDPWGVTESGSEQVENRFRFAGRECDLSTAFYYMRARYYDPATGRFLSEDPIGLAGGVNPYAYAANNPVSVRDPSGLDDEEDEDQDVSEWVAPPGCIERSCFVRPSDDGTRSLVNCWCSKFSEFVLWTFEQAEYGLYSRGPQVSRRSAQQQQEPAVESFFDCVKRATSENRAQTLDALDEIPVLRAIFSLGSTGAATSAAQLSESSGLVSSTWAWWRSGSAAGRRIFLSRAFARYFVGRTAVGVAVGVSFGHGVAVWGAFEAGVWAGSLGTGIGTCW